MKIKYAVDIIIDTDKSYLENHVEWLQKYLPNFFSPDVKIVVHPETEVLEL